MLRSRPPFDSSSSPQFGGGGSSHLLFNNLFSTLRYKHNNSKLLKYAKILVDLKKNDLNSVVNQFCYEYLKVEPEPLLLKRLSKIGCISKNTITI